MSVPDVEKGVLTQTPITATDPQLSDSSSLRSDPEKRTFSQSRGRSDKAVRYQYLTYETKLPDFELLSRSASDISLPHLERYDNPFDWSRKYKNTCLALGCASTFLAAYGAGVYGFSSIQVKPQWGLSEAGFETGLTTFCIGFGIAPMFLAPFSEVNGRKPVFLASGVLYLVCTIGCAVTNSFAGMLIARFFAGVGSSTYSTIIGGVISDIYDAQHRNKPMSIYSGFAVGGSGVAPLIAGVVVARVSWRWVFYTHAMALGVLIACQAVFFKETRGSVLLSRRADMINTYLDALDERSKSASIPLPSGGIRYKVLADEMRASIKTMVYYSATMPFKLLSTEPVVFFFSLWAAFAWGVLFMLFNVLPLVYQNVHHFDTTQQAAVFTPIVIGASIGTVISVFHEDVARKRFPKISSTPEGRLYFTCVEATLLPVGLFWFGWSSYSSIHWIVPTIAIAAATIGVYSVYLAVFNYLADVYQRYSSSALASQSFFRNTLGGIFPLFTTQMYQALGYPGASSLLGGIATLLTLVPWVLVWKGEKIRARSKFASEIINQSR